MNLVRDFSWQRGVSHFGSEDPRARISELQCGFAYTTPYLLGRTSNSAPTYPPASSLRFTNHAFSNPGLRRYAAHVLKHTSRLGSSPVFLKEWFERSSVVAEYERHVHRLRFSASA